MKKQRLVYSTLSPEAYNGFITVKKVLDTSSLGKSLLELVYLRISQLNGCAFCLKMHARALRSEGESETRLDVLAGWQISHDFSDRERAALAWAEALTDIAETRAPDKTYFELKKYFSDHEISDLTMGCSLMNAFNRLAISMRQ